MKATNTSNFEKKNFTTDEKPADVRKSNIMSAKALSDVVRTSLGPRGMDKMIIDGKKDVTITNDGATILQQMQVIHPTAKMLVEISKAQDIEAGDGTTSVVIIAGNLLHAAQTLLEKGIHSSQIAEGYEIAMREAQKVIETIEKKVDLENTDELVQNCITSLSSKVVSNFSDVLAPKAVECVMKLYKSGFMLGNTIDLRDVRVSKKLGGTVDETELFNGVIFADKRASHTAGGPGRIENPKVGLIQFCISSPKTDVENSVVVSDYTAMDTIIRQEKAHIIKIVKKIHKSGCNVLLVQKSVLRDALNDMALHYLAKAKIMVIRNVEREEVDFISKTIGCKPVSHVDHFTADKLGEAKLAAEISLNDGSKIVKIEAQDNCPTISVLCRGSNQLLLDEAERSFHDALCVVRSLVKRPAMLPGGGAVETEIAVRLHEISQKTEGLNAYCIRTFSEAMEIIPYTLAENAGLNPISVVTDLRNKHKEGNKTDGINVKKGVITDMFEQKVVQPSLVSSSALTLATEVTRMILKIDDIVISK